MIIINAGQIVASDTVANLHTRKSASESTRVEVSGAPAAQVKQALEKIAGVASVEARESRDGLEAFEVRGLENYKLRPELARTIVQAGWNLNLLTTVGESLEEIFLELTKSEAPAVSEKQEEAAVAQ